MIPQPWCEKYRPKQFSEIVGLDIESLKKMCLDLESMPHILLYSITPGTGKTTIAKVIINETGCESLILNASDERKIEDIREKVKTFVQCIFRRRTGIPYRRRLTHSKQCE